MVRLQVFPGRRRVARQGLPAEDGLTLPTVEVPALAADNHECRFRVNPLPVPPLIKTIGLIVVSIVAAGPVRAADAKERSVTAGGRCAKCEMKQSDTCVPALQVADKDGKNFTFLLADNRVSKDFQGKVCKGTLDGVSVTGFVKTEGGMQIITASKIAAN